MQPGESWQYVGTFTSTYTTGDVFIITGAATATCGTNALRAETADLLYTLSSNMDVVIQDKCYQPGSLLEVDLITRLLVDEDAATNPGSVTLTGGTVVQLPRRRFEGRSLQITVQGLNNNQPFDPFNPPAGISITRYTEQGGVDGGRNTSNVLDELEPVNTVRASCTALGQDDVGCEFPDWVFHVQIPVPANYNGNSYSVTATDVFQLFQAIETTAGSGIYGAFVDITPGTGAGGADTDIVPACCEKPVLTVGNPVCNTVNNTYSVSVYSSTTNLLVSQGALSGDKLSIVNIPVGQPVSVTAIGTGGCVNISSVNSPASCPTSPPGPNDCVSPRLTVGQPLCMGTTYTVDYTLDGSGTLSVNRGTVNAAAHRIENIPVGMDLVVSAMSGTCVTTVNVVAPASCTNVCENPAISLSGPICSGSTYQVRYTLSAGAILQVSEGVVSNGVISGIRSGVNLSLTVTTANGCTPKVVVVPAAVCSCEKPVITAGRAICSGNNVYSVTFYSSTTNITVNDGNIVANKVTNIRVNTDLVITATGSSGCVYSITVASPTSCVTPGPTDCSAPELIVGQPLCQGTTYIVALAYSPSASITVSEGHVVGNSVVDIPLGKNLVVKASSGTCVSEVNVAGPTSCNNICETPAISLAGPICSNDGTYWMAYTLLPGASIRVNAGSVGNGVISGIPSDTPLSVTVTLNGCTTKVVSVPPTNCGLELIKLVSKSRAKIGDVVSYTVQVRNTGSTGLANIDVNDVLTNGIMYITGSAVTSTGSITVTNQSLRWFIPILGVGGTASLVLSGSVLAEGVVYNTAWTGSQTATVCTSVPIKVCTQEPTFVFELSAPTGYSNYQWFRNGVQVYNGPLNSFTATAIGEYTVSVDNIPGKCPTGSCCPIILEADDMPAYQVLAQSPTCIANQPQTNGRLTVLGLTGALSQYTYQVSPGTSFNETTATPQLVVPADGVLATNLAGDRPYTVRMYNATGCYKDVRVDVVTNCKCPADLCAPVLIKKRKSRI